MIPWLELRDGNVPACHDHVRALAETLRRLPDSIGRVTVRTDGAGYQRPLIRFCCGPGVRPEDLRRFGVIDLVCGAKRSEALMREVSGLPESAWLPLDPDGTGLEWARPGDGGGDAAQACAALCRGEVIKVLDNSGGACFL